MNNHKKMVSLLLSTQEIEMLKELKSEMQFSVTTLIRMGIKLLKTKYKK